MRKKTQSKGKKRETLTMTRERGGTKARLQTLQRREALPGLGRRVQEVVVERIQEEGLEVGQEGEECNRMY